MLCLSRLYTFAPPQLQIFAPSLTCVYLGYLSYIHLVVIYSGLFIVRMMRKLIQERPLRKGGVYVAGVAEIIVAVESNLIARSRIVNGCQEMIIVGKSNRTGAERKLTRYRIWSGCEEWDKPVVVPESSTGAASGTRA